MPVQDTIVTSHVTPVTVALEPAHNALHSLLLLIKVEHLSGLGEWVIHTAEALPPAIAHRHNLVINGLHYAVAPQRSWPSFPAYVDNLATMHPVALRDKMLATYARAVPLAKRQEQGHQLYAQPQPFDLDAVLKDADSYLVFLRERFEERVIDEALETEAYTYVVDPPAMQMLIVSHLREMWATYLGAEWQRVEPMLRDSVRAFEAVDFSAMSTLEAARLITGQELEAAKWETEFEREQRFIFIPSPHIGPYLGKYEASERLRIVFGARLPEGTKVHAPDLSRTEIVVRLNALADDTRLRILKLVADQGEQSSQDVMSHLDLSQSAASRHLKQLSASGYLTERRCSGAKCYSLNPKRLKDTLRAISIFLLNQEV